MSIYFKALWAVFWKDVRLEMRSKDFIVSILVFSLLIVLIFNFAIDPNPKTVKLVGPGILWVSFLFGGILGFTKIFAAEREHGNVKGLLLAPVPREAIFFGKMISTFLFMLIVEIIVFPVFCILFNISLYQPELIIVVVLVTLGFSTLGTVFSALVANMRSREVILAVLFLPVVVPVLIAAVEMTDYVLNGGRVNEIMKWAQFLVIYDGIFIVLCSFIFRYVFEE